MDTIVKSILRHGAERPGKLALALKDRQITYGELRTQMLAAAGLLKEKYGAVSGERVAISAVSKPEYIAALLAAQFCGMVTVPVDKSAKEKGILDILEMSAPKLFLSDTPLKSEAACARISLRGFCAEAASAVPCAPEDYREPEPDAPAELIFTTGTTGKPKGATLTYRGVEASTKNTWQGIGMRESDRILNPLPLNHSYGMRVLRASLYGGASTILQNGFSFPKDTEENLRKYDCTALVSVPATMEMMYRDMGDRFAEIMENLRYIEISAGSMSAKMKQTILALLPQTELHNTWGSSESGGAVFLNCTAHPDKLSSIGRPIDGVEFEALGENGSPAAAESPETAGRMALRGAMVMTGYYGMPELTAETLHNGWLYTSDLVYRDADGFIYMLGRADDIINVGGEKVSPVEVENAAAGFEEICECACIGVDDSVYGQVPVLFVVPERVEFHEELCEKYLLGKLERHKLPRKYMVLDDLPRNRMKKLDRKALRALYERDGEHVTNEVIRNILTRRSIREFTDEPIPGELLETLVQCGTFAPSGHNLQTWRFTVIRSTETIAKIKEAIDRAADGKKDVHVYGFNNPQALILVSNDRRNQDGVQDSACAAENIMLAAHSLGLGSVWLNPLMTLCDEPEIRVLLRSFDVPDTHIVWAMIALGYPAQEGKLLAKRQDVVRWVE